MSISAPVACGTGTGSSSTTCVTAVTSNVPVGALLLVCAFNSGGAIGGSASDNHAGSTNSYAHNNSITNAAAVVFDVLSCVVTTALTTSDSVTVQFDGSTTSAVSLYYVVAGNGWLSSPLDQVASATTSLALPWSSGSMTTAQAEELIWGGAAWAGTSVSNTPNNGNTELRDVSSGGCRNVIEYQIASSIASYQVSGTCSSGQSVGGLMCTYKTSPPSPPPPVPAGVFDPDLVPKEWF